MYPPGAHGFVPAPSSLESCSNSTARVFDARRRWLLPPIGARHSGHVDASMAPPHYESIIYGKSGVTKHLTYLGDDEGMSVLAVVEMSSVAYTNFVSCRDIWRG
jgi:hypothetical protein